MRLLSYHWIVVYIEPIRFFDHTDRPVSHTRTLGTHCIPTNTRTVNGSIGISFFLSRFRFRQYYIEKEIQFEQRNEGGKWLLNNFGADHFHVEVIGLLFKNTWDFFKKWGCTPLPCTSFYHDGGVTLYSQGFQPVTNINFTRSGSGRKDNLTRNGHPPWY